MREFQKCGLEQAAMSLPSDEIIGTRIRGEILKEHGYSVALYNCPLAVLRCDLSIFDLAVLDFQMPD
jgi:CheY-like chemotaxis protein